MTNIGELTTNDSTLGDGSPMGRLHDAALVTDGEVVLWVGASRDAPAADERHDVAGAAVIPGFVDSHTHLVFAGERCDEFEARMAGERYDGGGIARTVAATRAASIEELARESTRRLYEMRALGTTTVEVKSGYDLTVAGEERLCWIARELGDEATFLGAHVVPEEYAGDRDGYVELVAGEMLDACAPLVGWADVFCERGAFSVDESRHVLSAARGAGLSLRVHGNQLGESGGVALGVELGAASVDHCTHLSDADVDALAASTTVATLLPGRGVLHRARPIPSARRLLDAGVTRRAGHGLQPGHQLRDVHGLRHRPGRARDGHERRRGALGGDARGSAAPCAATTSGDCRRARAPTWSCSTRRARRSSRTAQGRRWSRASRGPGARTPGTPGTWGSRPTRKVRV